MTIADAREKCKTFLVGAPRDVLIVLILVLASAASFGLGFLAGRDAGQGSDVSVDQPSLTVASTSGTIVASKNGTKYYLPSCVGADKIAEANKVWFASAPAAREAGYAPASNCKGL